jgi:hypothetical protein
MDSLSIVLFRPAFMHACAYVVCSAAHIVATEAPMLRSPRSHNKLLAHFLGEEEQWLKP